MTEDAIGSSVSIEKHFREAEAYHRAIIEGLPAMTVVNEELRIFDVNEKMVRRFGRPRGVLIGSRLSELGMLSDASVRLIRETISGAVPRGGRFIFGIPPFEGGETACAVTGIRAPDGTPLATILLGVE